MALQIREVMTPEPVCVSSAQTLTEVAQRMSDEDVAAVVVLDGGAIRGVLTDHDVVVRGLARGAQAADTHVEALAGPEPVSASPEQTVEQVLALMRARGLSHLPVVEDGRAVGIISRSHLSRERVPRLSPADISAALGEMSLEAYDEHVRARVG